MIQHKYQRSDKGQKRGKRNTPVNPALVDQPRDPVTNRFLPVVDVDRRQAIMAEALKRLENGDTTDDIGAEHNIAGSTLRAWLLIDESADRARAAYFAKELTQARDDIRASADPLSLARAREDFRSTSWLAERRLSKYYGPKQEVSMVVQPILNIAVIQSDQPPFAQIIDSE